MNATTRKARPCILASVTWAILNLLGCIVVCSLAGCTVVGGLQIPLIIDAFYGE